MVINTAAYTNVDRAETEILRCGWTNADAVRYLVEACEDVDCPLVQIGTDYVFGGDVRRCHPYRETDPPDPVNVYGRTKLDGEQHAGAYRKHLIVRTCGLYARPAPSGRSRNFVETMLQLARQRARVRVVDDQYCTPTYVPHLAQAVRYLIARGAHGTYHVTNSGSTTWYDFAAEILRTIHSPVTPDPISTTEYAATAVRPSYSVLDIGKYDKESGRDMPDWRHALHVCLSGPSYE